MIKLKIDLSNEQIDITEYGGMVLKDVDRQIEVMLSFEQVDKLTECARRYEGEKTFEELEQIIVDLSVENERLKDLAEQYKETLGEMGR